MVDLESTVQHAIEGIIEKRIAVAKDRVVAEAVASFEKQVRDLVGTAAIATASFYTIEKIGCELVVRIQIESGGK